MRTEKINLYEYFGITKPDGAKGILTTYVLDDYDYCYKRLRPAMLVIGGGGYAYVSDREKEPIAISYLSKGFNAYVLDYSVAPVKYPAQIIEASLAVLYIRQNAERDRVNVNKIAGIGFSAGGHLLGMLVTVMDNEEVKAMLKDKISDCCLNGAIFSYAVVSSSTYTHVGSMENLFGDDLDKRAQFSIDKRITVNCCPAFIWCTSDDNVVPSENSLMLAKSYRKAGVPFELSIFRTGAHGLSLCNEVTATKEMTWGFSPECEGWFEASVRWLNQNDFVIKDINN